VHGVQPARAARREQRADILAGAQADDAEVRHGALLPPEQRAEQRCFCESLQRGRKVVIQARALGFAGVKGQFTESDPGTVSGRR